MKNSFPAYLFIIFAIIITTVHALELRKQFYVVRADKTWQEARDYCRSYHTDLATIRSQDEAESLWNSTLSYTSGDFWIGLRRDTSDPTLWRWTELAEISIMDPSLVLKRQFGLDRNCSSIWRGQWYTASCSEQLRYTMCNDDDETSNFTLVKQLMTWENGRQYCDDKHQGMATIISDEHGHNLTLDFPAWIGLYKDVDGVWRWVGEQQSYFKGWGWGQPDNHDCGSVGSSSDGLMMTWHNKQCLATSSFLCYEDKLILVKENKTWEEALDHCRSLRVDPPGTALGSITCQYDLASLLSPDDHLYAREKIVEATSDQVWTGLRFLASQWVWVSGDKLEDHGGMPLCPAWWQHCGSINNREGNGTRSWEARDCSERRNFLCFTRQ